MTSRNHPVDLVLPMTGRADTSSGLYGAVPAAVMTAVAATAPLFASVSPAQAKAVARQVQQVQQVHQPHYISSLRASEPGLTWIRWGQRDSSAGKPDAAGSVRRAIDLSPTPSSQWRAPLAQIPKAPELLYGRHPGLSLLSPLDTPRPPPRVGSSNPRIAPTYVGLPCTVGCRIPVSWSPLARRRRDIQDTWTSSIVRPAASEKRLGDGSDERDVAGDMSHLVPERRLHLSPRHIIMAHSPAGHPGSSGW